MTEQKNNAEKNTPKKEILKETVDKIVKRRNFEPYEQPVVGCRFHRFKVKGESITGILGFPVTNWRQSTSYPLQLDSGEIVEIVGNRLLHKLIREGDLYGQRIEIQYVGREFPAGGPYRFKKVYRVFKIGFGPALSQADWQDIIEQSKKSGSKKNVKRKSGTK